MALNTSQWRSSQSYDFVDGLIAPDLAWEWLRRNADYQRDFAETEQNAADSGRMTDWVRRRWGLQFPYPPIFQRDGDCRHMGAGNRPRYCGPHIAPFNAPHRRHAADR
jgi:hypothetical protein